MDTLKHRIPDMNCGTWNIQGYKDKMKNILKEIEDRHLDIVVDGNQEKEIRNNRENTSRYLVEWSKINEQQKEYPF